MCGRYRLTAKSATYVTIPVSTRTLPGSPRWNIAPTQQVPVVSQDRKEPKRTFGLVQLGTHSVFGQKTIYRAPKALTRCRRRVQRNQLFVTRSGAAVAWS